jgi:hypothetical protein
MTAVNITASGTKRKRFIAHYLLKEYIVNGGIDPGRPGQTAAKRH